MYLRREFLGSLLLGPLLLSRGLYAANNDMQVFKDPTCGCCDGWIAHLKANGFTVAAKEVDAESLRKIKREHGIPTGLQSCHTAIIESYVIEGHVPADEIKRLMRERPRAVGLAVPGMPAGSPGMDFGHKEKYAVFLFKQDGSAESYREYPG